MRRLLSDPRAGQRSGRLCFSARGFSLYAATRIEAADRSGLERLCRYVLRPPLAGGRLALDRCGSSEVPSQDALVRWNDPPCLISVGTDREIGCAGTSAPAQPGALSRRPGAQCRISSFGGAGSFGVAGRFIGGGLYGFPLSSSLRLGRIIGAGFCRGCDALSALWWPTWSGSGAERSGLDRPLFERGWFSGRTSGYRSGSSSATARIGSGLLS